MPIVRYCSASRVVPVVNKKEKEIKVNIILSSAHVRPTGFSWNTPIRYNSGHILNRSASYLYKMNKPLENNESTVAKNGNVESSVANEKSAAISADISLPNDLLERLYQRYSIKQRRAGLGCFLATSVLFDLWAIFAPQQEKSFHSIGKFIHFPSFFVFVSRHPAKFVVSHFNFAPTRIRTIKVLFPFNSKGYNYFFIVSNSFHYFELLQAQRVFSSYSIYRWLCFYVCAAIISIAVRFGKLHRFWHGSLKLCNCFCSCFSKV